MGTSSKYPRTSEEVEAVAARGLDGIFNLSRSPLADAHTAYVRMCSNDAYMADVSASQRSSDSEMGNFGHFRGQRIIEAVFMDLRRRTDLGAQPGDLVVYGGCSSGARGAMVSMDSVATKMVGKATVLGLLDSPLWVPLSPLHSYLVSHEKQTQLVLQNYKATKFISEECRRRYPDDLWKCLFGAYRLPLLKTPFFLSHSQYDAFGISSSVQRVFSSNPADLSAKGLEYAEKYRKAVLQYLPAPRRGSGNAVFSSAAYQHCTMTDRKVFDTLADGLTLPQLLERWLASPTLANATFFVKEGCQGFNCGRASPEHQAHDRDGASAWRVQPNQLLV
jgi:hypothetical protein